MNLSSVQSREIFEKYKQWVKSLCDSCGKGIGPYNRFTIFGSSDGIWCSRQCRDGVERRDYGTCIGCGGSLEGKRKGSLFCSDTCRKRTRTQKSETSQIIAETHIQN